MISMLHAHVVRRAHQGSNDHGGISFRLNGIDEHFVDLDEIDASLSMYERPLWQLPRSSIPTRAPEPLRSDHAARDGPVLQRLAPGDLTQHLIGDGVKIER